MINSNQNKPNCAFLYNIISKLKRFSERERKLERRIGISKQNKWPCPRVPVFSLHSSSVAQIPNSPARQKPAEDGRGSRARAGSSVAGSTRFRLKERSFVFLPTSCASSVPRLAGIVATSASLRSSRLLGPTTPTPLPLPRRRPLLQPPPPPLPPLSRSLRSVMTWPCLARKKI